MRLSTVVNVNRLFMKRIYETEVTATGGRNGHLKSRDGTLEMDVAWPKELEGPGGAPNPEMLMAGAWSACFGSALDVVAQKRGVKDREISVTVNVHLLEQEKGFNIAAELRAHISDVDAKLGEDLVKEAAEVCPYSNATRGNVETTYAFEA